MPGPRQLTLFGLVGERRAPQGEQRRHAFLDGRVVEYRISRRRRRTIAISVDAEGLAVSAPPAAPWRDIEAFISSKARWITSRLEQWRGVPRPVRLFGIDGETLCVAGETLRLEVRRGAGAVRREPGGLVLELRNPLDGAAVCGALVAWLKCTALEAFAPRAGHFARRLGLSAPSVALSSARSQWGNCDRKGRIRIAWRLVHVAPRLADYVIAHEVAHLAELNHSRRFWATLESLYPDCRTARRELHLAAAAIPHIGGVP